MQGSSLSANERNRGGLGGKIQGGTGIGKKDPVSIFLSRPLRVGLTDYVIRNTSIFGNMTSLLLLSSLASSTSLTSLANPVPWFLLKFYTLEVVLDKHCE